MVKYGDKNSEKSIMSMLMYSFALSNKDNIKISDTMCEESSVEDGHKLEFKAEKFISIITISFIFDSVGYKKSFMDSEVSKFILWYRSTVEKYDSMVKLAY